MRVKTYHRVVQSLQQQLKLKAEFSNFYQGSFKNYKFSSKYTSAAAKVTDGTNVKNIDNFTLPVSVSFNHDYSVSSFVKYANFVIQTVGIVIVYNVISAKYGLVAYAEEKPIKLEDIEHSKSPIIDLSEQYLTIDDLKYILSVVKKNKFIGHIKWGGSVPSAGEQYRHEIETELLQNNIKYQRFPTDFTYSLLSSHSYHDSKPGDVVSFDSSTANSAHNDHLQHWEIHKTYAKDDQGYYYSASYRNDQDRQLVLAHRGTDFTKGLLAQDSSFKTDLEGVLAENIVAQQRAAYAATEDTIAEAKQLGYSFSTTGHSLGAWLAELSLFHAYKDFGFLQGKAVTFDSPGSVEALESLKSSNIRNRKTEFDVSGLDVTTYLSAPNFVNTCNSHVGKIYRLYPDISSSIPSYLHLGIKAMDRIGSYKLEGIWSNFGHSLDLIITTFDPDTGKPREYTEVTAWPKIKYNSDIAYKNMLNTIFSREKAIFDNSLTSLFYVLLAAAKGKIGQEQYLEYLKQIAAAEAERTEGYKISGRLTDTDKFKLLYEAKYQVEPVELNQDIPNLNRGNIDYHLAWLQQTNKDLLKTYFDELIAKQLIALKTRYKIIHAGNNTKIVIESFDGTVDDVRELMYRLISLDQSMSDKLSEYHSASATFEHKKQLYGTIGEAQTPYYTDRLIDEKNIFHKFDQLLKQNDCLLIHGPGGSGKTTCLQEYVHRLKEMDKIVVWFNSDDTSKIYQEYIHLAKEFKINPDPLDRTALIRIVNRKLFEQGRELVVVFDNSKNYDDIKEYINDLSTFGAKYIITARNPGLIKGKIASAQLELGSHFTTEEAQAYLHKAFVDLGRNDKDIGQLLSTVSKLPLKLSLVISYLLKNPLKSVQDYLQLYQAGEGDQPEFTLLFQDLVAKDGSDDVRAGLIVQYAALLDPDFIDTDILKNLLHIDDEELQSYIKHLQSLSLVKIVTKDGTFGIKIHRDIQQDVVNFVDRHAELTAKTEVSRIKPLIDNAILYKRLLVILDNLSPKIANIPADDWQIMSRLANHIGKILANIDQAALKSDDVKLLTSQASLLHKLGLYNQHISYDRDKALKYYSAAEHIYQDLGNKLGQAELLIEQGWCYFDNRRTLDKSEQSFTKALALISDGTDININVKNSEIKADALIGLARNYDKNRDSSKPDSLKFYQEALKIYQQLYPGQEHQKIAAIITDIGWYYREKGQKIATKKEVTRENLVEARKYLQAAERKFDQALEMRKKLYQWQEDQNQPRPDIITSISNKATLFNYFGRQDELENKDGGDNFNKALQLHLQVLKWRQDLFQGQAHQDLINSHFRLAETYQSLKNYSKALEHFEQAKEISYKIQNSYNHGPIIYSLQSMAAIYEEAGYEREATEYYKKAYSIVKRNAGDPNYDPKRPETKKIAEKLEKHGEEEFVNSDEIRIFITKHGLFEQETYDLKNKLQEKILNRLYECAQNGQWKNSWFSPNGLFSYGAASYLDEKYIRKIVGDDISEQNLAIAQSLCVEAMSLGIMSNTRSERNLECLIKFATKHKALFNKIIEEHPEYFVDGWLLLELSKKGLIDGRVIKKIISSEEYKYLELDATTTNQVLDLLLVASEAQSDDVGVMGGGSDNSDSRDNDPEDLC